MVPNEVLDFREISLYTYLLRCEDRKTYQCWPSYKTIGGAIRMSENAVTKYVRSLEDKGLIYTEPTLMQSKDGKPLNGNLRYTIRPIQGAVESFYERQFRQEASPSPNQVDEAGFGPFSEEIARTTGFPPKPSATGSVREGGAA